MHIIEFHNTRSDFLVVVDQVEEEVHPDPGDVLLQDGPGALEDGHVRRGQVEVVHVAGEFGIFA